MYIIAVKVNGFPCKNTSATADFTSRALATPFVITNPFGYAGAEANVLNVPGLNTLGVSMARVDYAPSGIGPPHVIRQGEVFVFPKGLVHFQKNTGKSLASIIVAFNSQLPGIQLISPTLFGSSPPVPDDILAQTFLTTPAQIALLRKNFVQY
ncbi:Nectarin-1 [Capsicum annuum]|uniref:Germin-like protein n=1 Tax=Capsicum annuum TaxID=4072 RepID=A0A2G2XTX5_CAPAN|nr:Nectarin-1 [Capsicum annuum]